MVITVPPSQHVTAVAMKYRGLTLDPFQIQAIQALEAGRSALVCAPTGTGKTIVADWVVDAALENGRQAIYTAPVKALSNQKFRDYVRLHGEENVGLVTGDLVIRRDAPCVVMTTEILRNMLLGGETLPDLQAVVLDEIHFLDDRERGTVWEEVLIYLPKHVQIVGLSATLSNLDQFAGWLTEVRGTPVEVVVEEQRAVPLTFHMFSVDTGLTSQKKFDNASRKRRGRQPSGRGRNERDRRGKGRSRRPPRRTSHLDAFRAVANKDLLPFLYFVFSRRDTEECARGLGRFVGRRGLLSREESMAMGKRLEAAQAELPDVLDDQLARLYSQGIAFHHAGLHVQLKALVEELYEQRLIKALYCTSTFALGINMPARCVVFDGWKKYDGRGFAALTTRQFMQKAGRAGRRGKDDVGHVVLRMDLEEYEEAAPHVQRFLQGKYEPVRSSFNLGFNSIINLIDQHRPEHIRALVERSFLAWHLSHRADERRARAEQLGDGGTKRARAEAARLRRGADRDQDQCWSEFQRKVNFLQDVGYLDTEWGFASGARVLRHLQIAEVFVTELVLSGLLEPLDGPTLFGVACAVTNELPRSSRRLWRPDPRDRGLLARLKQVRFSGIVVDAEEISGTQYSWDSDLLHLGRRWAAGDPLADLVAQITSRTDLSGDLITGFRRAKDLLGQLRMVYADDPSHAAAIKQLIRTVTRDEVEVVG
jgi:superfamily II RNA helicase